MIALARQPVMVSIASDSRFFQFYSGGVLSWPCGTQCGHSVMLIGYGSDKGQEYWLMKNSWGTQWGEHGYARLARGYLAGAVGECGILKYRSVYQIVSEK